MVPAHVMELDALARGKADAAVGIAIGGLVEREPLRGRQLAARGILDPHHEDEVAVLLAAFVALALFVDAEMLGDFLGLLANRLGLARAQRVDLRAHRMTAVVRRLDVEQPLARMLEALDGRHFRHARAFERYRRSAAWMVTSGTHWLSWLSPSARVWLGASEASALRPCGVWLQYRTSRVCAPQGYAAENPR